MSDATVGLRPDAQPGAYRYVESGEHGMDTPCLVAGGRMLWAEQRLKARYEFLDADVVDMPGDFTRLSKPVAAPESAELEALRQEITDLLAERDALQFAATQAVRARNAVHSPVTWEPIRATREIDCTLPGARYILKIFANKDGRDFHSFQATLDNLDQRWESFFLPDQFRICERKKGSNE